jgi:hypothetical protein
MNGAIDIVGHLIDGRALTLTIVVADLYRHPLYKTIANQRFWSQFGNPQILGSNFSLCIPIHFHGKEKPNQNKSIMI